MVDLYELHEKMTAHLFPAYSSQDERFLALALVGEVGELCNMVKKRWRDNVNLTEEIRDEHADIRIYLELLAKRFDIEGDKLNMRPVQPKAQEVSMIGFAAKLPDGERERFLALSLSIMASRLADCIAARWVLKDVPIAEDHFVEEARNAICFIRLFIELLAKEFDVAGSNLDQRVIAKLKKVAAKHAMQSGTTSERIFNYINQHAPSFKKQGEMNADEVYNMVRNLDVSYDDAKEVIKSVGSGSVFSRTGITSIQWLTTNSFNERVAREARDNTDHS